MDIYDSLLQDSQRYRYRIYTLVKNVPLFLSKVSELSDFIIPSQEVIDKNPLFLSKVSELSDFIIPSQEVIDKKISFSDWISSIANKELNLRNYTLKTRWLVASV